MRNLICVLLSFLVSMAAQAQVYKWVDQNGKIQYSDQPPPSGAVQNEKKLGIKSSPPPSQAPSNDDSKSKEVLTDKQEFDKRRKEKQEKETQQQAEAEENKKKCIDAQGRQKIYMESPRLTVPDGKGGIVYVDDDARQKQIDEAAKAIATYCK